MTDRELLELAAKAAGHCIVWGEVHRVGDTDVDCTDLAYVVSNDREESPYYWSPLTDDGDALRLAVKLRMGVTHNDPRSNAPYVSADVARIVANHFESFTANEDVTDECARDDATRRAIVRAAAEIGKALA